MYAWLKDSNGANEHRLKACLFFKIPNLCSFLGSSYPGQRGSTNDLSKSSRKMHKWTHTICTVSHLTF